MYHPFFVLQLSSILNDVSLLLPKKKDRRYAIRFKRDLVTGCIYNKTVGGAL